MLRQQLGGMRSERLQHARQASSSWSRCSTTSASSAGSRSSSRPGCSGRAEILLLHVVRGLAITFRWNSQEAAPHSAPRQTELDEGRRIGQYVRPHAHSVSWSGKAAAPRSSGAAANRLHAPSISDGHRRGNKMSSGGAPAGPRLQCTAAAPHAIKRNPTSNEICLAPTPARQHALPRMDPKDWPALLLWEPFVRIMPAPAAAAHRRRLPAPPRRLAAPGRARLDRRPGGLQPSP